MPFKPEVKPAFLDALRGGNYEQTQGTLRRRTVLENEPRAYFCCLGVLCNLGSGYWATSVDGQDVYHPADGASIYDEISGNCDGFTHDPAGQDAGGLPPAAVWQAAGLTVNEVRRLANMNDDGKTFLEIADVVEKEM